MKKILITQSNLTIGGIQKTLINFLKQLDLKKYEVDLVLFEKKGELLTEVPSEVNVFSLTEIFNLKDSKIIRILREMIGGEKYFKKLYKNFNNHKEYDVGIAFDGYVSFTDYYVVHSMAKKKIIWVHSDFYSRKKYQKKFRLQLIKSKSKYKYFDKIVSVSKSAQEGFLKIFPMYSNKITYIWNYIDEVESIKIEENSKLVFEKNKFNIVSIGALLPVKGYERLVEVQKKLKENNYDTKVYIIGEGSNRKKIEKKIKKYRLEKDFILLGKKDNIYPILKQANLFVLSSYYEGFGVVLLESLSMGIPILVPDISGAKDVATEIAPNNSSIITKNSINGIYDGIVNCIKNKRTKFLFDIKEYNIKIKKTLEQQIFND